MSTFREARTQAVTGQQELLHLELEQPVGLEVEPPSWFSELVCHWPTEHRGRTAMGRRFLVK